MKLFTPRKDLKTPLFPIIKIIISIIIIVLSINRKEFYSFFNIEIEGIFDEKNWRIRPAAGDNMLF